VVFKLSQNLLVKESDNQPRVSNFCEERAWIVYYYYVSA
jgi:hypothetical protein